MRSLRAPIIVALAILLCAPVAASGADNPHEKSTITDIQYRISYSLEIPGNCAVLSFSQWSKSKFRGWDAYKVAVTYGAPPASTIQSFPISPAPKYDDELPYGGNIVSPPASAHWALIGDGSFHAGPPPAEPECQAILARAMGQIPDHKVTTYYRRTDLCISRYDKVAKAKKAVKKAKSRKAKSKAKKKLKAAEKSFSKSCAK